MPPHDERRPLARDAALGLQQATASDASSVPASFVNRPTIAAALFAPPCGGRELWAIVVPTCPHCDQLHQHRADGGDIGTWWGVLDRHCPVTRRPYKAATAELVEMAFGGAS